MSVRDRRLENDYQGLLRLCVSNENIKLLDYIPEPRKYVIQISNVVGVESINYDDAPVYRTQHILEISNFALKYPQPVRDGTPTVRFQSPIFHPNVYLEGLADFSCGDMLGNLDPPCIVVLRLIAMIQYANTDFGCPANHEAKRWYERNKHKGWFPLGENQIINHQQSNQIKWRNST